MDAETIKAIADQIADQTILTSWKTWSIQFALWLLGVAGASFAGAYLAKRGEHNAIKADFASLKDQLAQNTKAVTTIETEIAHQDWATREWKVIRREKIEELLKHVAAICQWCNNESGLSVNNQPPESDPPGGEDAMRITTLYLPELKEQTRLVIDGMSSVLLIALTIRMDHGKHETTEELPPNWENNMLKIKKSCAELTTIAMNLEHQAAALLRQVMGVDGAT